MMIKKDRARSAAGDAPADLSMQEEQLFPLLSQPLHRPTALHQTEPGRSQHGLQGQAGASLQHPVLPRDGDRVQIRYGDAGFPQAIFDGMNRKRRDMPAADEALFLRRRNDLPVPQQSRRGIAHVREAQHQHGCVE